MNATGDLHLLGWGLDAIIAHTRPPRTGLLGWLLPSPNVPEMPRAPTDRERLERYNDASMLHADRHYDLRVDIGEHFKAAWKRGQVPDLRAVARSQVRGESELWQLRRDVERLQ